MEPEHSTDSTTLPERNMSRYKPRFDPSEYPRRNGSTSVNMLTQDKAEPGSGERMQSSESGILQERLAYINRERFERDFARQQGGEPTRADTPQPRQLAGDGPAAVIGNGARGAGRV